MSLAQSIFRLLASIALMLGLPAAQAQTQTQTQIDFGRCIDGLRAELRHYPKVRPDTFAQFTGSAHDMRLPIDAASRSQPEFQLPIWDYLARLVDDKRVRDGRAILQRNASVLASVATQQRVDPATLVAILGVESDFGRLQGQHPVVDATLSRACLKPGDKERKAHFFAALWLLQEGLVRPDEFRGSWAGAFGMTQFMPGTFVRYMSDGDSNGVIDSVNDMPDAVATAAHYLRSLGWTDKLPWGIEVTVPRDIARLSSSSEREHACLAAPQAQARCRRLDQWAALGLVRADGQALRSANGSASGLADATPLALLTPAGPNGPAWLVSRNFQVIWQYNHADSYALAIGLLSSALRDEPGLRAAWPTAEAGLALSRTGMAALQELLLQSGHCNVAVDGYDGPLSRQAVRDEERRRGLPESGRPTTSLLDLMRAQPPALTAACTAAADRFPAATAPARSPDISDLSPTAPVESTLGPL